MGDGQGRVGRAHAADSSRGERSAQRDAHVDGPFFPKFQNYANANVHGSEPTHVHAGVWPAGWTSIRPSVRLLMGEELTASPLFLQLGDISSEHLPEC